MKLEGTLPTGVEVGDRVETLLRSVEKAVWGLGLRV